MTDAIKPAERMALTLTRSGMQRMAARVLCGVLFADQETITAGEIAQRLSASAGAVSSAIKMLEPMGLIVRAPVPGSRREHYRVPDQAWLRMVEGSGQTIEELLAAADEGISELGESSVGGLRLAEMRDFYRFVQGELPRLLDEWRRQRGQA